MSDEKQCPQCGAVLSGNTPEGLCPACLLKRGLETQTAGGAPSAANVPPPTPEALASFFPQLEILELLGRGGMGAVYKARHRELNRLVALKILPSGADRDPAFAERFGREARALAQLDHPNIVSVYDSGQANGLFYFIMEYVDGANLRQVLSSGGITPREALAIVPQICDALQYAHDRGIVHRDIKPQNILVDKTGRVKIADFGIAKIAGRAAADFTLTGEGEMMGTPAYMAPEQMEHPSEVDHRADIYSLGVVFYQMLTGELPLGRFAPPSSKVQIDVRLDDVVLRTLEKEPERRYQQAGEVKTRVETIAGTPGDPKAGAAQPGAHSGPPPQPDFLHDLAIRFWPPLVVRHNGARVINWPAVAMRSLRALLVILIISIVMAGVLTACHVGNALLYSVAYFLFLFLVICFVIGIRILRGFALPVEQLPSIGEPGASSWDTKEGTAANSAMPGAMWFAAIVLGSIIVIQLLIAAARLPTLLVSSGRIVIGAVLSAVLLACLVRRSKWAYASLPPLCAFGVFSTAHQTGSLLAGSMGLLIDALVFVPVLLSTRWFFPAGYPEKKRRRWLWGTAVATVLAAVAGIYIPFPKAQKPGAASSVVTPSPQTVQIPVARDKKADEISKSFKVGGSAVLNVDADRGSIEVKAVLTDTVEVIVEREVTGTSDDEAARILKDHKVAMSYEGNQVWVTASGFPSTRSSWFESQPNLNVHYRIITPVTSEVHLKTAGGAISVNDDASGRAASELQGTVEARTSGGSLRLARIKGFVNGRTSGGNIRAVDCTGRIDVQTTGGNIDLQSCWNANAGTTGGNISAVMTGPVIGNASLTTTGGEITVRIPQAAAINLEASTTGGSVSCDLPVQTQGELGRDTLIGKVNGGGPTLLLRTTGGGIRIMKAS